MSSRLSSLVHSELCKRYDMFQRCDACDECEQQTNHLSKSVFTQTTGKMLPWQPDSGGTSSFSVPVEMSHTNAARNGDIKWLVLCSTHFSLSLFLYLSLPSSLSHICTHLGTKSSVASPESRNSETLCWIIVSDNIVDLIFHSYEHNRQEHTWACTLKNNIEICIFPWPIIPPESVIAHMFPLL